ncbi:MAG: pilus assembly protein N-terminal domain-containing protein [Selenomonadaceae bacterium]|nr:pilus assembly protein N-terminal domain-containing protein [Selenomonadaceae bacterium]
MKRLIFLLLVAYIMCVAVSSVYAQNHIQTVNLNFHSSKHIKLNSNITRIYVGSRTIAVADRLPPAMDEFIITSTGAEGTTTIFVWTVDGSEYEYTINVFDDESRIADEIERAINLPDVHVKKVDKKILLTGTVKNQYEKNYAIQVARLYADSGSKSSLNFGSTVNPQLSTQSSKVDESNTILTNTDKVQDEGNVIDLLQMLNATQIRLEAQVLAISSEDAKDIGILYGNSSPSGMPGVFYVGESYKRNESSGSLLNPWNWLMHRHDNINMQISALITNSKAKILSRPSIMTLSGEQATIQIGGEIPYTTYDENNRPSVKFRDYGIILQFKPIVDAQGNIVSTIYTEVSNVSGEYVGDNPIIATRRADSVVSLQSGTTMVIGGLMDSSERKVLNKIPLLGDIPIIGEFFKYSSKTKDKQELIILVTPYIVGDDETGRARMSESMRDLYNAGQEEKDNLNDVDLNNSPKNDYKSDIRRR